MFNLVERLTSSLVIQLIAIVGALGYSLNEVSIFLSKSLLNVERAIFNKIQIEMLCKIHCT